MKILFVCRENLQRSPTAEKIFKNVYNTKSAGISPTARIVLTKADLDWADLVVVMEKYMQQEIARRFPEQHKKKKIISFNIPDIYLYMDPELVKLLRKKVKGIGL